jgi:hypothetical protein
MEQDELHLCAQLCKRCYKSKDSTLVNKNAKCYIINQNNTLYIAWCGTDEPRDFLSNLDISLVPFFNGGHVHQGFLVYSDLLREKVLKIVKGFKGGDRIVFTGHSLGSCVLLIAIECKKMYPCKNINYVSFGSPMIGDTDFVNTCESVLDSCTRVYDENDPVCILPSAALGYCHLKNTLCISGKNNKNKFKRLLDFLRKKDKFKEHKIDHYIGAFAGPGSASASALLGVFLRGSFMRSHTHTNKRL